MKESKAKEAKGRRLGLFGGTFNPIHLGHLRGAEEVRESFELDEVIFIPAAIPPHKGTEELIDARHRLEMVRLAIQNNPFFSTSEVEILRPGKSYSIDTIKYYRETNSDDIFFILGKDGFVEIETWKDFKTLFSLCNFIVMTRPGFEKAHFSSKLPEALTSAFRYNQKVGAWSHFSGFHLYFKEITFLDISSTKVRELIEKGESVRYLIPSKVEEYIRQNNLYKRGN